MRTGGSAMGSASGSRRFPSVEPRPNVWSTTVETAPHFRRVRPSTTFEARGAPLDLISTVCLDRTRLPVPARAAPSTVCLHGTGLDGKVNANMFLSANFSSHAVKSSSRHNFHPTRRLTACVIAGCVGHAPIHCDSDPRAWGSGDHARATYRKRGEFYHRSAFGFLC